MDMLLSGALEVGERYFAMTLVLDIYRKTY
jgi:hypothetical protein